MTRTIHAAAALTAAIALSPAAAAHAQERDPPTFRTLARDGQPVSDGSGSRVNPAGSRDVIGLDRAGRAIFDGSLLDAGGAFVSGDAVFVGDGDAVRLVFRGGGPAPADGVPVGGSTIQFLGDVRHSPSGELLVQAFLEGGSVLGEVLLTDRAGAQRVEAVVNQPFRGLCGLHDITNGTTAGQYALNGGHLVFHFINSSGLCGDNLRGMVRARDGGALSTVAIEDGPVPGAPGEEWDLLFTGPSLNEDGDYLFLGRYQPPGSPLLTTLVLSRPSGELTRIATTGTAVPGTADTLTSINAWRVGRTASGATAPRVAYVVGSTGGVHVLDTAHGNVPILSEGHSWDGFTFTAGQLQLAIANNDSAVIVADTTGNGIPSFGEAVWRMDTALDPPMQVVLHEGGPVPGDDPRAAGFTISRLFTVNVNEDGRLAVECELSPGNRQAILLEERSSLDAGRFRVALLQRDVIEAGDGSGEVFGLLGQIPSSPRVTGPGDDSLQTRFNANGQFVFRGRTDPEDGGADFNAIYTVSIDPPPRTCDVTVRRRGRNLVLTGDDEGDCRVTIRSETEGELTVVPGEDTTLNGESRSLTFAGVEGSIKVKMGAGNDVLTLESTDEACDRDSLVDVFRNLTIDTGSGLDRVTITDLEILGSLTVKTGSGGKDTLDIVDTCVARNLKIVGGRQEADLDLRGAVVDGRTVVKMPSGPRDDSPPVRLGLVNCTLGATTVKGGSTSDDIDLDECDLFGNLRIDTRGGILEQVRLDACRFHEGTTAVKATRSDTLILRITGLEQDSGGLTVNTGFGGCDVSVSQSQILRDVRIKTGDSRGDARINKVAIGNSVLDSAFVLRGKGSHDVFVGSVSEVVEGIAVNTKGGVLDLFGVSSTEIGEDANIQLASRAGAMEARVHTNTVLDGHVSIRGTKGPDAVYMNGGDYNGSIKISLGAGDDLVDLDGVTVIDDLRLFGGPGNDRNDSTGNGVGGATVTDSFELP